MLRNIILVVMVMCCPVGAWAQPTPGRVVAPLDDRQIPILMYHHITDQLNGTSMPLLSVSPKSFAAQLDYLKANGYTAITLSQAVTMTRLPAKPVVLTFDDGYLDFYEQAWPLLRERGMVATLFVVTGALGGLNQWDIASNKGIPPERLINQEQLRTLERAGIEIGGHSNTHPMMPRLSDEQLRQETTACQQTLSKLLGHKVNIFCYPYGMYDDRVCKSVADADFTIACTTDERAWHAMRGSRLRLPRYIVERDDDLQEFIKILQTGSGK